MSAGGVFSLGPSVNADEEEFDTSAVNNAPDDDVCFEVKKDDAILTDKAQELSIGDNFIDGSCVI